MLGYWNFPTQPREGKTPQTQPPVETKEKEYGGALLGEGTTTSRHIFLLFEFLRYRMSSVQC